MFSRAYACASAHAAPCSTTAAPSAAIRSRAHAVVLRGTTTVTGTPSRRPA